MNLFSTEIGFKRARGGAFLGLFFAASQAVAAPLSQEEVFFYIHQAGGHSELRWMQNCKDSGLKAQSYLQEARKMMGPSYPAALRRFYQQAHQLSFSPQSRASASIKKLNGELHVFASRSRFAHDLEWHEEFKRCLSIRPVVKGTRKGS